MGRKAYPEATPVADHHRRRWAATDTARDSGRLNSSSSLIARGRIGNSSSLSVRGELSAKVPSVNYHLGPPPFAVPRGLPPGENKDPERLVVGAGGQIRGATARTLPAPSGWKLVVRGESTASGGSAPATASCGGPRGDLDGETSLARPRCFRMLSIAVLSHHDCNHAHAAGAAWARRAHRSGTPASEAPPRESTLEWTGRLRFGKRRYGRGASGGPQALAQPVTATWQPGPARHGIGEVTPRPRDQRN